MLALGIGAWLVYKSIADAGVMGTIVFRDAQGIEAGKTQVIYRGLPVGLVKAIDIDPDFQSVRVQVEFDKVAKRHLREHTRFWLVSAKVSASEVTGLETLFKGNHIGMQPGDGEAAREFTAHSEPPVSNLDVPGLSIKLVAETLGSLQPGSKVFHRGIEVGEVLGSSMGEDSKVVIEAVIKPEFAHKVTKASRFYNSGGVSVTAGLTGFELHAESLASVLAGGVSFFQAEGATADEAATNGDRYRLYDDYDAAEHAGTRLSLILDQVRGLRRHSPIKYKGVNIGRIESIGLSESGRQVEAKAVIHETHADMLREHSRFWLVEPKLGLMEARNLGTLITGSYIAVKPGKGKPADRFRVGLEEPETIAGGRMKIVLKAGGAGSIKVGNKLFFRGIAVGEVAAVRLAKDSSSVLIDTLVERRYAALVRENSVFWRASGINVDFGLLSGAKVHTGSLRTILEGGLAFATPGGTPVVDNQAGETHEQQMVGDIPVVSARRSSADRQSLGKKAKAGSEFALLDEAPDGWENWTPKIKL